MFIPDVGVCHAHKGIFAAAKFIRHTLIEKSVLEIAQQRAPVSNLFLEFFLSYILQFSASHYSGMTQFKGVGLEMIHVIMKICVCIFLILRSAQKAFGQPSH